MVRGGFRWIQRDSKQPISKEYVEFEQCLINQNSLARISWAI
jgi:hypothetical protein